MTRLLTLLRHPWVRDMTPLLDGIDQAVWFMLGAALCLATCMVIETF